MEKNDKEEILHVIRTGNKKLSDQIEELADELHDMHGAIDAEVDLWFDTEERGIFHAVQFTVLKIFISAVGSFSAPVGWRSLLKHLQLMIRNID